MPHKKFDDISILAQIIIIFLGFFGAIANYAKRQTRNFTIIKKLLLFIVDMATSASLAIVGFYATLGLGKNELLAVAVGGILAHQGTRALYLLELIVTEKIGAKETFNTIKGK